MSNKDDQDWIESLVSHFDEIRPFNRVLGLTRDSMDIENACVKFSMKNDLLGNTVYETLHGGVISAILDIAGGFVVFLDLFKKTKGVSNKNLIERLAKVATIDLRVDYLRPGIGTEFTASGYILRTGKKVAVVRTELCNEEGTIIAVGTASYIVG